MRSVLDFLQKSVVINDNRIDHIPRHNTSGLYGFDGSRHRRIDWCRDKSSRLCNFLTSEHLVPFFHYRHCRRANMLTEWIHHFAFWHNSLHGLIL